MLAPRTAEGDGIGSAEIRRDRAGGAYVEERGGGLPFSRCGGTAGDPEKVNQLVLNRDHRLGGGDSLFGRGGRVFGNVPKVTGNPAEPEHHLSRQGSTCNR